MNHLHDVGLEVHAQTVLERVEKPETCHTSSYNSQGKYLEMRDDVAIGASGCTNATWF